MNEICPVYKGMLKPIIISYKLTTCQLLILYKYLQTLRNTAYNRVHMEPNSGPPGRQEWVRKNEGQPSSAKNFKWD